MFEIVSYREWIEPEMTDGDALDLERLTCEARAIRASLNKRGERGAMLARLKAIHSEAHTIQRRYA